jgi:hypothetical protein
MRNTRWRIVWRAVRRRLIPSLTLVAYLGAAIGFPVSPLPAKQGGQPFPCQNHQCGCRSAEECWRHCCCFTAEQRWAWAREHHVEPPAVAEPPSTSGWRSVRLRDLDSGKGVSQTECACCAKKPIAPGSTAAAERGGQIADRQTSRSQAAASLHRNVARPSTKPTSRWSVSVSAFRCHGLASVWVSSGAVLPSISTPAWAPCLVPVGWLESSNPAAPESAPLPPVPPPRIGCV